MQKLLIAFIMVLMTYSLTISTADAARFGGGRSFGMTRNVSSFSRHNSTPRAMPMSPQQPANSGFSKWLGPLAGFAAGGLLASLFMGHGLGSGILSWLLIGGAVLFILSLLRSRSQSNAQPQQAASAFYQAYREPSQPFASPTTPQITPLQSLHANFDEPGFLRESKGLFIRLQKAYDDKNLSDLREFTAPEVYAEIQLQLQERGNAANQTDVISIEAELLDVSTDPQSITASTLFTGFIREEVGQNPVNIKEIWHFRKNANEGRWIVAGIQQTQ